MAPKQQGITVRTKRGGVLLYRCNKGGAVRTLSPASFPNGLALLPRVLGSPEPPGPEQPRVPRGGEEAELCCEGTRYAQNAARPLLRVPRKHRASRP